MAGGICPQPDFNQSCNPHWLIRTEALQYMSDYYDDDEDLAQEGVVFNVQKYSVHDGPGIRTNVFLKGCNLRCRWCSNPESQHPHPELAWNEGRCIGLDKCGHCLTTCKKGAIVKGRNNLPSLDRSLCGDCAHDCAKNCPAQGLLIYGQKRTVKDVLDSVEQDMAFYSRSGGGMTLTGGEPLMHRNFAVPLLRQARKRHLKTAIETCGMVPEHHLRDAAPYLTYALFDIKHMDSQTHKENTGAGNERILNNFRILAEEFPDLPVLARTPIIPGVNDNEDAITAIAEFLRPYTHVKYEMLPYHRLGTQKYLFLQRTPPMGDVSLAKSKLPSLHAAATSILGNRVQAIK